MKLSSHQAKLNLLAALVLIAGGWLATTPAPVVAQEPGEACCYAGEKKCCGDKCKAKKKDCKACTGFWGCLFF